MLNLEAFSLDSLPENNHYRNLAMEAIHAAIDTNTHKQAFLNSAANQLSDGKPLHELAKAIEMCSIGAPQADVALSSESMDVSDTAATLRNMAKYLRNRNQAWATLS